MAEITTFQTEFHRDGGWRTVIAALFGVAFGLTALPFYTLGVFAKPLATAFGWSRGTIQTGVIFSMVGTLCSAWAYGWLIDRFGVRRVALCSQVGLALGFVGLASQQGSSVQWYLSWFAMAIMGVGTTPLTWSRGIADWFVVGRGRALGVALAGTGCTAFLAPPLVTQSIALVGWRATYLILAACILLIAWPMAWLFFRHKTASAIAAQTAKASPATGLTIGEAARGYRFWLLIISFAGISFAIGGSIPSLVPTLIDHGLKPAAAAGYASMLGLSVIFGRLASGWLVDKVWAPIVAVVLLAFPAVGCVLLASAKAPLLVAVLIGLAGGAEFDLMAYLCMRYFGMRNYGQIYAWQWAAFSLSAGLGSGIFGITFDRTGSYAPALLTAALLMFLGPLLLLFMGRYPAPVSGTTY